VKAERRQYHELNKVAQRG